jgi:hypothetical protein
LKRHLRMPFFVDGLYSYLINNVIYVLPQTFPRHDLPNRSVWL